MLVKRDRAAEAGVLAKGIEISHSPFPKDSVGGNAETQRPIRKT
jgi:hypothetical protein